MKDTTKTKPAAVATGGVSIEGLNKMFNHRTRMGIMAVLMVGEWTPFVALRDALDLTDGSLASHLKALSREELVEAEKRFVGGKPQTTYRATAPGRAAFEAHLRELEAFINGVQAGQNPG